MNEIASRPPDDRPLLMLGADAVPEIVDVLWESFFDYPVMRFVCGEEGDYESRLRTLVGYFTMARVLREEEMVGVRGDGGLEGVALVSRTGEARGGEAELRASVWGELGADARSRYDVFAATIAPFVVDEPHIHLNMLGVRDAARGTGLGRLLVEHVHQLSASDPRSRGVTLTTEDELNVSLYKHLGYEVVGEAVVAPGLRTWGFFRADRAAPR